MKKLRLDLDHLSVESFEAGDGQRLAGTVRGHVSIACEPSYPDSCDGGDSCDCPKDSTDSMCYACG